MSDGNLLTAFYRLFQANSDFFVRHQAPFIEEEGKLKASWCGFAKYGSRSFPKIPEGYEKGDLVPLTKALYKEHLMGGNGIAAAPLLNMENGMRNMCFYAAIDIDAYSVSYAHLVVRLSHTGLKFAAFLSKSGGLHIYFFFPIAEPGDKVIKTLKRIVEAFGLNKLYVNSKGKSKVEIFPKQATFIPGDTNVSCLFLPFYGGMTDNCKNIMLSAEGTIKFSAKSISAVENSFTSLKEIQAVLDKLPYSDAPYCIQMIILTGALGENDYRNNFLYAVAIYLKKQNRGDFYEQLEEINSFLEAPLDVQSVQSVYRSVTGDGKSYDNYPCKKSPCVDYCDKKLCTYGVRTGKKTKNVYTGMDTWGEISKVVDSYGEVQHYLWNIRINENDDFKTIHVNDVADFENQSIIRTACRRHLNWAPNIVRQDLWIDTVNTSMEGIQSREVVLAEGLATSEDVMLRHAVMRYITHKQIQNGQPYMVKTGQVYHADGKYYFTTEGVTKFLQSERHSVFKVNLYTKLVSYGCDQDELSYITPRGAEIKIPCWSLAETPELLRMDKFYDDIYEGDADIIQKNPLNKDEPKKEAQDGDTKF